MARHIRVSTRGEPRSIQRRSEFRTALTQIRAALRFHQWELGSKCGVSARTILRWECGYRLPTPKQHRALVSAMLALDVAAAERLAASRGTSLVELGLVAPSALAGAQPPPAPSKEVVENALYAAAEEMDIPAARVRAALAKLFRRYAALGLGWEQAAIAVAPAKPRSA